MGSFENLEMGSKRISLRDLHKLRKTHCHDCEFFYFLPKTNYTFCLEGGEILEKKKNFSRSSHPLRTHMRKIHGDISGCYLGISEVKWNHLFGDEKCGLRPDPLYEPEIRQCEDDGMTGLMGRSVGFFSLF